jgi:FdrA protein
MQRIEILKSTYLDSVSLMRISKMATEAPGVTSAVISMATDTNLALMKEVGFSLDAAGEASANDLVIAVDADSEDAVDRAFEMVKNEIKGGTRGGGATRAPRSLEAAIEEYPEINLVLISVPGRYAAYEARRALAAGRHVMIFSDNVSVEDEIDLKEIGAREGLLVMGPDCGTAMIAGVGLGFANNVPPGKTGIVSASGTGAQEVASILGRLGLGVSHIIGTGGRDVSSRVGAITMKMGLEALAGDSVTEVIVIISKAPDPGVAEAILAIAAEAGKPCIVSFAGRPDAGEEGNLTFTTTLAQTALAAARALTGKSDDISAGADFEVGVDDLRKQIASPRRYLRGLYSGGTLAQEALFLLGPSLGAIHSNLHVEGLPALSDPGVSEGHTIVDLGDDVFTRGRAHPMIDQAQRLARLKRETEDPEVAVILLDVVLGYGCNSDPGGEIAAALREIAGSRGSGVKIPLIVASICGTHGDPQGYDRQRRSLEAAGVVVAPTNAHACELVRDLLKGVCDG